MAKDIVERIKECLIAYHSTFGRSAGGATEDALVRTAAEAMMPALLELARNEIEFLRQHAGAVTRGESFDEIAARVGRAPKDDPK